MELAQTYSPLNIALDDIESSTRPNGLVRFLSRVLKGIENKLIKQFTRINIELEGILSQIMENKFQSDNLINEYRKSVRIVKLLSSANEKYRSIDFIGSQKLEDVMTKAFNIACEIEAELKIVSHQAKPISKTEELLKIGLAKNSHFALSKKLSHQF